MSVDTASADTIEPRRAAIVSRRKFDPPYALITLIILIGFWQLACLGGVPCVRITRESGSEMLTTPSGSSGGT